MKKLLPVLLFTFIFLSCSKKDKAEEPIIVPTNELVGTTWERYLTKFPENNKDLYNYLSFKTASEVEFTSKLDKVELTTDPIIFPYTYDSKKVVYRGDGYNYTGTFAGDTLKVIGTAGILVYIKVK
ncbi:hypothetical protein [Dyadobacter frigoris]|uniref:Lipoprotein n=1 Tax=Dyadobacter frigoris TaxID=2576211 RepID=A0A4U6D006_9BACT|nr:hypothetical protein [Dyadobacter frigoris]TKT90449.1 hypothetical protein FDK13_19105 [Dyadobacter frigoris]GLU51425.1 hypothetical protein Dfri01_08860 [Dyadobacter frigoris]